MNTARRRGRAAAAGVVLWAVSAAAAPVKSVRVTTYQELAEGQASGVILSSQGEARSGFSQKRLSLPSLGDEGVRAMAAAADGAVYLGTGGDAPWVLVYEKGQLRRLAKLDAGSWVTALCVLDGEPGKRPAGAVLAATAQDGRIFRVHADGKSEVVAELPAEHVWALLRDGARGLTYAVTGPGALWAIPDGDLAPPPPAGAARPKSRARKIFASEARQFLSLHRGEDGALYVGTADDAVLYRIDPGDEKNPRAVHDFAGNEVRAIAHHKDAIFVAVNDMQRGDTQLRGTKIVPPAAGTAPGVKAAPPAGTTTPASPSPIEKKGRGALYRIDASGRVEQLHAIVDGFFNAIAVDKDGNLLAAASTPGGRGRVYWVAPDRTVYTALEVKESDVLSLSLEAGPLRPAPGDKEAGRIADWLAGTGNSGALYSLQAQPQDGASYLSRAFFTQAPSRWGSLRYSGDGTLRIETRSGNLAKPDASWSSFQPLVGLARQPSTGEQVGKIASPPGRYLQVRVAFPGPAVLRDFSFFYQPINQRPRLTEILVGEDPSGRVARAARAAGGRPRSPVVKLRWKVENPDEDDLSYRVYLRPARGASPGPASEWLRIGGTDPSQPLLRSELDLNTETVADGLYELKVVVSDERSNPPDLALSHELVSPPFLIDNRRPEVRDLSWNAATGTLSGRATDATSPIAELSYAVDGGDFYPLGAKDGVLDDLSEDFAVRIPRLAPGLHTVLVRASDAADNPGVAQITVTQIVTDASRPASP